MCAPRRSPLCRQATFGAAFCAALLVLLRTPASPEAYDGGQGIASGLLNAFALQQRLFAPDGFANDEFGEAIAISGTTAVVGATGSPIDGTTTARGAAYVFIRAGAIWTFQAKLVPGDSSPGMQFGDAVAVSGNIAVVGAPFHDLGGRTDAGAAYVFRRSGNLWQQEARLLGDSAALRFGRSVSIDGNTVVVGSDDAEGQGSAYVFVPGVPPAGLAIPWLQQQKLLAPNGEPDDDFGESVALRGNTVVVGARERRVGGIQRGAAFVFNRSNTTWTVEPQEIVAPDGQEDDLFGRTVVFDGVHVLVSASDARVNGVSSGAVYAFLRQGAGWVFEQKLTPDVPRGDTDFGRRALALDGTLAAAGIPESGTREGFVFRFAGGTWTRERVNPAVASRLATVALAGTTLFIGSDPIGAPGTVEVLVDEELTNGFALPPPVLAAPTVAGSTVTLNWNAVAAATRYQLRAGTSPGGSNAFNGDVGNTTTLTAAQVPNGSYFVRVHAVAGTTESVASNEVRVDVGPGQTCQIPPAPTSLAFTRAGSLVTLTWNAAANATSYVIEAGSSSGASNIVVIDTGNAATQLLANAPPGTYFVRVRGKSACGTGLASNQVVITVS